MDQAIVNALQSWAGRSPVLDSIGIFLASGLIWLEVMAVVIFWFLARRRRALAALSAFLASFLAWCVSQGIGLVWFRPRPFADMPGVRELIAKSALDKSFPSDHATIAFALAFAVFLTDRRWGIALFVVAALICLGRVFVGVHYPTDILGGALIGMAVAWAVHRLIHYFLHTRHKANHL
jgi:undecaprenyl-diphosphatase